MDFSWDQLGLAGGFLLIFWRIMANTQARSNKVTDGHLEIIKGYSGSMLTIATDLASVKKDLELVRGNDLPHLREDIKEVSKKLEDHIEEERKHEEWHKDST